jgi:hypothetical protein
MRQVLVARECVMEAVAWLAKEGEGHVFAFYGA